MTRTLAKRLILRHHLDLVHLEGVFRRRGNNHLEMVGEVLESLILQQQRRELKRARIATTLAINHTARQGGKWSKMGRSSPGRASRAARPWPRSKEPPRSASNTMWAGGAPYWCPGLKTQAFPILSAQAPFRMKTVIGQHPTKRCRGLRRDHKSSSGLPMVAVPVELVGGGLRRGMIGPNPARGPTIGPRPIGWPAQTGSAADPTEAHRKKRITDRHAFTVEMILSSRRSVSHAVLFRLRFPVVEVVVSRAQDELGR